MNCTRKGELPKKEKFALSLNSTTFWIDSLDMGVKVSM